MVIGGRRCCGEDRTLRGWFARRMGERCGDERIYAALRWRTGACGAAVLQGRQTIIANSGDEYSFDSTFVF